MRKLYQPIKYYILCKVNTLENQQIKALAGIIVFLISMFLPIIASSNIAVGVSLFDIYNSVAYSPSGGFINHKYSVYCGNSTRNFFGYTSKGSKEVLLGSNTLLATNFRCAINGTATMITIYLKQNSTETSNVKCAVYVDTNSTPGASSSAPGALIGYTEELTLTGEWDGWKTLNMTGNVQLTSSVIYWLVVWSNSSTVYLYRDDGEINQSCYQYAAYGDFPDPFPPLFAPLGAYGIVLSIILFPIVVFLGFLSLWKRKFFSATEVLGILYLLGAVVAVASYKPTVSFTVQYGLGIYIAIVGFAIFLAAYSLKWEKFEILRLVGALIFLFSMFLPLAASPVSSVSLMDTYITSAGGTLPFTFEMYSLALAMTLYPISMILCFLTVSHSKITLIASVFGIICWASAILSLAAANNLQNASISIYAGLAGAIILLIAHFYERFKTSQAKTNP